MTDATAQVDPFVFQILRHKLYNVTAEATAALKNVSGTPYTNVAHDMMVALYTADGKLAAGGVGYAHHIPTAAQAVKHLIASFSDDPGIEEDDIFFFNDPYLGAIHAPDVYIVSPIFFEGSLRAFFANFVHVADIGAIDPGGFCPNATDCFDEGFMSKGLKIVEGGKVRTDIVDTFLNMVRDPGMVALDLRSQMAANHVAKERVLKLYRDYGYDTVDRVANGLIDQSEALMRERLRELPDGQWRACEYIDVPGAECKVEVVAIKKGARLEYDFSGSSDQVPLAINCSYWATWGAMLAPVFPLLGWDVMWNEGVTRPLEVIAPEGSVVNCRRPAPVSVATVGTVISINNVSTTLINKMLGATEKYKDRVTAVWRGTGTRLQIYGTSQGQYFTTMLTDSWCGSGGATAFADGIELGGEIPNVVSAMGNVELHELHSPLVYLYRRVVRDSGGPGRFRGGVSHEYGFTPHRADNDTMGIVATGKGTQSPMALGISGGYPGCNVRYLTFRRDDATDLPASLEAIGSGNPEGLSWGNFQLSGGDIQHVTAMGGGGYGDPLERSPEAVLADVSGGFVSENAAREQYGVLIDPQTQEVDAAATTAARLRMRSERIGRVLDESAAVRREVPSTAMRINEYLQRTDGGGTQCTWCGTEFAAPGIPWKEATVLRRSPVKPPIGAPETFLELNLTESFCPSCATLFEVEVSTDADGVRHDSIRSWPAPYDIQS